MSTQAYHGWSAETLIGGHPALDFVNTAGGRSKGRDVEWLNDYDTLLHWSAVSATLQLEELDILRLEHHSDEKHAELLRVRRFREALHSCLMAEQAGANWPHVETAVVETEIRLAIAQSVYAKSGDRLTWDCKVESVGCTLPRLRLALTADELLRSEGLSRIRNCDRCSWLFLDQGRGRPRRWCSMATCGSRAKSARYYSRQKTGAGLVAP